MSDMALGMTERLKPIHERVARMVRGRDHAARRGVPGRSRQGWRPLGLHGAAARDPRRAEGQGARARPVEFLADRIRARLRPHAPSNTPISPRRWARRISAPRPSTARRPTPATWRCWSATARHEHKEQWLAAAARRQDPLGLSDDRAGRRLVRRHQHRDALRARRRRLCAERREMVGVGRRRSALRDLHRHGQDRRRRRRSTSSIR